MKIQISIRDFAKQKLMVASSGSRTKSKRLSIQRLPFDIKAENARGMNGASEMPAPGKS
jgi:hypothetical protein